MILSEVEARVLGSLIEKDITTPDYYPLSLNALVNASNQKNNRDPVMTLEENAVRDALATLQEKRLAGPAGGADSRVTKFEHRLQEVFNFDRREIAVLCVLLLRGPQTPGELRSRADRMYHFEALEDVVSTLDRLSLRTLAGSRSAASTRNQRIPLHPFILRRTDIGTRHRTCGAGALARSTQRKINGRPHYNHRRRGFSSSSGTFRNPAATRHLSPTI